MSVLRFAFLAIIASAVALETPALAAPLAPPTECWIENQTPEVQLGGEARYVVHLSGGGGRYSVSFSYGDGWTDTASVTGPQATFAHWFDSRGTFTQTANVSSMGSSASCTSSTRVW